MKMFQQLKNSWLVAVKERQKQAYFPTFIVSSIVYTTWYVCSLDINKHIMELTILFLHQHTQNQSIVDVDWHLQRYDWQGQVKVQLQLKQVRETVEIELALV